MRQRERRALASNGARADTPADIFGATDLAAWFRRSTTTLGTPPDVATWPDQSAYLNDVSQGVASQRAHQTSAGLPLDFDAVALQYFSGVSSPSLTPGASLTVAFRCTPDLATSSRVPVAKSTGTGSWSYQTNVAGLRFHVGNPGASFGEAAGVWVVGTPITVVVVVDGLAVGNAARLRMWINGVAQTLSFTGTIPATIPVTATALSIGAFAAGAGQYFDGTMNAVVIANAVATDSQRQRLETYLGGA